MAVDRRCRNVRGFGGLRRAAVADRDDQIQGKLQPGDLHGRGGQREQNGSPADDFDVVTGECGETAGATGFDISVLCDGYAGNVLAYFENGPTTNENGNLDVEDPSDGQSASGVQVQLLNGDGSPIKVGDISTMKTVSVEASTPTPIPFFARYYATGKSGAGKVRTYVTFVIQML